MRRAIVPLLLICAILIAAVPSLARAEPRTALVIGNAAYPTAPLANAVNDARDVADALTETGFEVTLVTDADQRTMDDAIRTFGDQLKQQKGVGLFYYSGHGIQFEGSNYLLPANGRLTSERDVKYRAVNLGQVLDELRLAGNGLNIVVVDACRNNPLASAGRGATRGLARVESGGGLFISYSTSPGEVALDGTGRNSPFTKHLVAAVRTAGLSLEQTFKKTLKGVYAETSGKQIPWISSSFFGDFTFRARPGATPPLQQQQQPAVAQKLVRNEPEPAAVRPAAPAQPRAQGGAEAPAASKRVALAPGAVDIGKAAVSELPGLYRVAGTNPEGVRYTGSLALIEDERGRAYRFIWWIAGDQMYLGKGVREGRWLRVDWGSTSPVIYTIRPSGVLDGLWADGSASDVLTPHAPAHPGASTRIAGRYAVSGRDTDGTAYEGVATIAKAGDSYTVTWNIQGSTYQGHGKLDGGILMVDWGSTSPAVYAVGRDGVLTGLWDSGKGQDVLTPR